MPDRLIARLLQAILVTALVGGTTAFVAFDKTVTVSVDGEASEVRSFARTVGDVLGHRGHPGRPATISSYPPPTNGSRAATRSWSGSVGRLT